jgi:hypothetical protein
MHDPKTGVSRIARFDVLEWTKTVKRTCVEDILDNMATLKI